MISKEQTLAPNSSQKSNWKLLIPNSMHQCIRSLSNNCKDICQNNEELGIRQPGFES